MDTRTTAHFCQDEHQPIWHNDSEHELCPLCRANNRAEKAELDLTNAQAIITGDGKVIDQYREQLAAAIERLREAEKDAERYRYVRVQLDELYASPVWTNDGNHEEPEYWIDEKKLDSFIDAALAGGGHG
jgi:hypothetical protein